MYITLDATTNKFDFSTVYYGANFVDYIGHGAEKLIMVSPSNGKFYDSFVLSQYFNEYISGDVSADDNTLLAIEAINRLPSPVLLEHEDLVIAARAAYDKLTGMDQKALVYNYSVLITAETRIEAFKNSSTPEPELPDNTPETEKKDEKDNTLELVIIIIEGVLLLALSAFVIYYFIVRPRLGEKKKEDCNNAQPSREEKKDEKSEPSDGNGAETKEDGTTNE